MDQYGSQLGLDFPTLIFFYRRFFQVTHAEGFVLFPGAVWKLGEMKFFEKKTCGEKLLQEVGPKITFLVGRPFFRCEPLVSGRVSSKILSMLNCGEIIFLDSFKHLCILYTLGKTS